MAARVRMYFETFRRACGVIGAVFQRHPYFMLAAIGIIHRIVAFIGFRTAIDLLASPLQERSLMQFFTLDIYREHFPAAMWLLQQTPPVPHLVIKALLSVSNFPLGFTHMMFFLQSGITIATACLLLSIIRNVTGSIFIGFVLSLWFMLSTDILVLENVFYGQQFYENLSMLFITACCAVSIRLSVKNGIDSRLGAGATGLFAALAALTRSSVCYFDIVPLIAVKQLRTVRMATIFLGPVLLLQGGWAAKNAFVYGHLSWETSTWGGYSAAKGLDAYGQRTVLCKDILGSPTGTYPTWFLQSVSTCPFSFLNSSDAQMPSPVQDRDAAMRAELGSTNVALNGVAARMKSQMYGRAVMRYAAWHPVLFARRFVDFYPIFWQRLADDGAMFPSLFSVERVWRPLFDLSARSFHEKQYVAFRELNQPWPFSYRKARFLTLSLAPMDAISIVVLHRLFPLLLIIDLWQRWRRRRSVLPPGSYMLGWTALYGAIVFNAVDAGENMRFRLTVEPAIIALTAVCISVPLRCALAQLYLVGLKARQ